MGKVKALAQEYGTYKTIRLKSMKPVFTPTIIREEAPAYLETTRFVSAQQVYELFLDLRREPKEHFMALHLDGKNRIICFELVSLGSLNQSVVHPREVFKSALLSSAAALILIHNHPSGDPSPSSEDCKITQRLREAGDLLGIKVLDHLVVGDSSYYSFADHGGI